MSIQASDWLAFLENRLAAWTRQMNLLVGFGGLLPLGSLLSAGVGVLANPIGALLFAGFVTLAVMIAAYYLVRVVTRRRRILALMHLILGGALRTPEVIGVAYAVLMHESARKYLTPE